MALKDLLPVSCVWCVRRIEYFFLFFFLIETNGKELSFIYISIKQEYLTSGKIVQKTLTDKNL